MKLIFKHVAPFTLAILCLASMMLPVLALMDAYCIDGSTNHERGENIIRCNSAYERKIFDGPTYCYKIVNERCDTNCEKCGSTFPIEHTHQIVQHNYQTTDENGDGFLECDNSGCLYAKSIY